MRCARLWLFVCLVEVLGSSLHPFGFADPGASVLALAPIERAYIAAQRASGQDHIQVMMAARRGAATRLADRVRELGGEVLACEEDVDFVRARVPIDRVPALLELPTVQALQVEVDFDAQALLMEPSPAPPRLEAQDTPRTIPRISPDQPNPHTGEAATQVFAFKKAHPTYDGRGAVIGTVEPTDLPAPSGDAPKILDYLMRWPSPPAIAPADAVDRNEDESAGWYSVWRQTVAVRPDAGGWLQIGRETYATPPDVGDGELRATAFRLRFAGKPMEVAVLWSVTSGAVWTGSSGAIELSRVPRLVVADNGAVVHAAVARPLPGDLSLRVAIHPASRTIGIDLGNSTHGNATASVAAGQGTPEFALDGVAPRANLLVSSFYYLYAWRRPGIVDPLKELAWLPLFRDPRVDLITHSMTTSEGRKRVPDWRRVDLVLLDRLQRRYPKLFITAAGNDGPVSTVDNGPQGSSDAVTVGGYIPADTLLANFGIAAAADYTPAPLSNFGPAFDGGLKPDVLGLTGIVAGTGRARSQDGARTRQDGPVLELPNGYGLFEGTSMAAPYVSGCVALIVSAARQAGLHVDPARVRTAIFATAKFLPGVEARVQGRGLVQVADAWRALTRLQNIEVPSFEVQAAVQTFYSPQLATPHVGRGLFEREGWAPGQTGDREITITRTSGPREPITYRLRWKGDTGAFSSRQTTVSLALNRPVRLPIRIAVRESRAYSAILDLIDPRVDLAVHSVLCTVIVAEQLTARNSYTASVSGTAPRPGHGFAFVNVPAGTTALRIQVTQRGGTHVSANVQMPDAQTAKTGAMIGEPAGAEGARRLAFNASDRATYDHTFMQPMPGVWQIWLAHDDNLMPRTVDASERGKATRAAFTVTATAIAAEVRTEAQNPARQEGTVRITNRFAALSDATVVPLGIGRMREAAPLIGPGLEQTFYDLEIAPDTARVEADADIGSVRDVNVSLLLFYLGPKGARPVSYDIGPGGAKHILVMKPKPGRYKLCLDVWGQVPRDGVRVQYRDILYRPTYGEAQAHDRAATLAPDQTRTAAVSWVVNTTPADGRVPVAQFGLIDSAYQATNPTALYAPAGGRIQTPPPSLGNVPLATRTIVLSAHPSFDTGAAR